MNPSGIRSLASHWASPPAVQGLLVDVVGAEEERHAVVDHQDHDRHEEEEVAEVDPVAHPLRQPRVQDVDPDVLVGEEGPGGAAPGRRTAAAARARRSSSCRTACATRRFGAGPASRISEAHRGRSGRSGRRWARSRARALPPVDPPILHRCGEPLDKSFGTRHAQNGRCDVRPNTWVGSQVARAGTAHTPTIPASWSQVCWIEAEMSSC